MRQRFITLSLAVVILGTVSVSVNGQSNKDEKDLERRQGRQHDVIQLDPRPAFLIKDLENGRLKRELLAALIGIPV